MEPEEDHVFNGQLKYFQDRCKDASSKDFFKSIVIQLQVMDNLSKGKSPQFLSQIFNQRPDRIKIFEDQLEKEFTNVLNNTGKNQYLKGIESQFLEALCLLPKSYTNSGTQLDESTLNKLGIRTRRSLASTEDEEQRKRFMNQAIWYSILGAKLGHEDSYVRLKALLEFGLFDTKLGKLTKGYTTYYTFLINFLLKEDAEAQNLFVKVALESEDALNWAERYIQNLEKNETKEARAQLKVLNAAMGNFNEERAKKKYLEALEKWNSSPAEAINCLNKAEEFCPEAEEKLSELRKSKGYLNPKKVKANDHGRLLKKNDTVHGLSAYKEYKEMYNKASHNPKDLQMMASFLGFAVKFGNPEANKEHKRLENSKGYNDAKEKKNSGSKNFDYIFAHTYHSYQIYDSMTTLNNASQKIKSISSSTTSAASTIAAKPSGKNPEKVESTSPSKKQNSTKTDNKSHVNSIFSGEKNPEEKNESKKQALEKADLIYKLYLRLYKESHIRLNTESAVDCLYNAINLGSLEAIEELERLQNSQDSEDMKFMRVYKVHSQISQGTRLLGIESNINHNSTKYPAKTATTYVKQSEPVSPLSTSKPNNTNAANNTNSIALTSTNVEKNGLEETQKLLRVSSPTQTQTSADSVMFGELFSQGFKITEDMLPPYVSSFEEMKKEKKEKQPELPAVKTVISDQIPTQSQEEGQESSQAPHKIRRTLERTQSLIQLPTQSKPSEELSSNATKKPIKRTLSLSKIPLPTQSQPSEETQTTIASTTKKKNKFSMTKMNFKTLKLTKKKEKAEEKVKQSSSSTKTSSSLSKSQEQLSKSEEQMSKSQAQISNSEEQTSRSEDYLSSSKEKVPFSKLTRALQKAQREKDVKLTKTIIMSTLKELHRLNLITKPEKNGNTLNSSICRVDGKKLTIHLHDDSGTLWYKKPEVVTDFLQFVGLAHPDLEDQINKIGKK